MGGPDYSLKTVAKNDGAIDFQVRLGVNATLQPDYLRKEAF